MIKDSGERRKFDSGAVRDITEGKGRCDLMPLEEVAEVMQDKCTKVLSTYQRNKDVKLLYDLIRAFSITAFGTLPKAMLEVSIHFEEGATKYGENNWQEGIPEYSYIDSAVRHYLKWLDGLKDEPHDRAFIWNLLCLAWTHNNFVDKDCIVPFDDEHDICQNCAFYISEPESQLYQKCMKDSKDTTVSPSHWCEKWRAKITK